MFNGALALWGFFLVRFIWRFSFQGVGRGNPILLDSHGKPPPSTFNYARDIARCCRTKWAFGRLSRHLPRCSRWHTAKGVRFALPNVLVTVPHRRERKLDTVTMLFEIFPQSRVAASY